MKLILVEDDTLLRKNLTFLLEGEPQITVVGSFASAEEALADLAGLAPDIMIADIDLISMSGIELIQKAKVKLPMLDIMVHTMYEGRDTVFAALKAGASGYLLKGSTPREIIEAVLELYEGGAPMTPKIARYVINEFQELTTTNPYSLTLREQEILKYLSDGLTYKEIGKNLCLSYHTIHTHIKNIYEKLHTKTKQEAILKAKKHGII